MSSQDFNIRLNAEDRASKPISAVQKAINELGKDVDNNAKHWKLLEKVQKEEEEQQRRNIEASKKNGEALKDLGVRLAAVNALFGVAAAGAAKQRQTQVQLAAALDTVGVKYGDVEERLEGVIAAQQRKTAVSDEEQREALRVLLLQTGDYQTALEALPVALDLAASTGQSLRESTLQLGKVVSGATPTIESLGLKFDATATGAERLAEVQQRVNGQAEAALNPFDSLLSSFSDIGDEVGKKLLPFFDGLARAMFPLVAIVEAIPGPMIQIGAAIVGGAGLVVGFALLRREVNKFITTLKSLTIWQNIATGGLASVAQVIGGAAVAGTLIYAVSELEGSLTGANEDGLKTVEIVKELGKQSAEAGKGLDSAAKAATRLGEAGDEAKQLLKPFSDAIDDMLVATGKAPDASAAAAELAASLDFLDQLDLGGARDQIATYGREVGTLEQVWSAVAPGLRAGAEEALAGVLDALGVGPQQIADAGGDVNAAFKEALLDEDTTSEMRQKVTDVLNDIRRQFDEWGVAALVKAESEATVEAATESLEPMPEVWSFAGLKSREALVDELETAKDAAPVVVDALVTATAAKAEELIPAFEAVGAALPQALVVGLNRTSDVLEEGFNSVVIEFLRQAMEQMNAAAQSLGARDPFPNIAASLPSGLDLPHIPEFALGSFGTPGGAAIVGERGAELAQFPSGTRITPAHQLAAMLSRMSALQGGASLFDSRGSGQSTASASPSALPMAGPGPDSARALQNWGTINVYPERGDSRDVLDMLVRAGA